jgi:hypothetical protein
MVVCVGVGIVCVLCGRIGVLGIYVRSAGWCMIGGLGVERVASLFGISRS